MYYLKLFDIFPEIADKLKEKGYDNMQIPVAKVRYLDTFYCKTCGRYVHISEITRKSKYYYHADCKHRVRSTHRQCKDRKYNKLCKDIFDILTKS